MQGDISQSSLKKTHSSETLNSITTEDSGGSTSKDSSSDGAIPPMPMRKIINGLDDSLNPDLTFQPTDEKKLDEDLKLLAYKETGDNKVRSCREIFRHENLMPIREIQIFVVIVYEVLLGHLLNIIDNSVTFPKSRQFKIYQLFVGFIKYHNHV